LPPSPAAGRRGRGRVRVLAAVVAIAAAAEPASRRRGAALHALEDLRRRRDKRTPMSCLAVPSTSRTPALICLWVLLCVYTCVRACARARGRVFVCVCHLCTLCCAYAIYAFRVQPPLGGCTRTFAGTRARRCVNTVTLQSTRPGSRHEESERGRFKAS
jgi:hypothetical protein